MYTQGITTCIEISTINSMVMITYSTMVIYKDQEMPRLLFYDVPRYVTMGYDK